MVIYLRIWRIPNVSSSALLFEIQRYIFYHHHLCWRFCCMQSVYYSLTNIPTLHICWKETPNIPPHSVRIYAQQKNHTHLPTVHQHMLNGDMTRTFQQCVSICIVTTPNDISQQLVGNTQWFYRIALTMIHQFEIEMILSIFLQSMLMHMRIRNGYGSIRRIIKTCCDMQVYVK